MVVLIFFVLVFLFFLFCTICYFHINLMINCLSFRNCLYLHLVIYLQNYLTIDFVGFEQFLYFISSFIVIVILFRFIIQYFLDFVIVMIG